jgi:3-oxoacyl-[acyl-carrier-protein] synthase II
LREAEQSAADIGLVSANGVATVHDDIMEAQAIREELGNVPVFAPKSYFGHLGAGTSTVETVATVCALAAGQIPGTLNYDVPDPRCPVNVSKCLRPMNPETSAVFVLSHAPTGQAASLLLGKP